MSVPRIPVIPVMDFEEIQAVVNFRKFGNKEEEEKTADAVEQDMGHIMAALLALDNLLKQEHKSYLCSNFVTRMDVIMYNELSQVLCMHTLLFKSSQSYRNKDINKNVEPDTSD